MFNMLRLFTKKHFFAFLASFIVTFFAGFFVWNIFINSGSALLSQPKFFSASILPDTEIKKIIPATEPEPAQNPLLADIEAFEPAGSTQDILDDIQEKLDIIQHQVNELANASKPKDAEENSDEKLEEEKTNEKDKLLDNPPEKIVARESAAKPFYLKILISEVQVAGITDKKEEFVKLYNPNSEDVDLTDWYLQRKTKDGQDYSTFVSNSLFSGKKISANGYFLICREGYYFNGLCNIFTENPLTDENYLVLKNPNREISDEFLTPPLPPLIINCGGGGGGSATVVYQKILISEVQISTIEQRFV